MGCLFLSAQVKEKFVLFQSGFLSKKRKDRWHSQFPLVPILFRFPVCFSFAKLCDFPRHTRTPWWMEKVKGLAKEQVWRESTRMGINGAQLRTLRSKMHITAYLEPNSMKLPSLLQNWLWRGVKPSELLILYLCFVQFQRVSREKGVESINRSTREYTDEELVFHSLIFSGSQDYER